ncbi:acetyl-CoA carboxylase biotin carboxyl carrier protein [Granulicella sp. 5B5]|uniref:acetyl-CoA carboxylase biotin carboxyl carrier protein n=1 Tax=Granulicella sp. 5B5 TaxID=1617967 RepID=UPI0015F76983|nr:acetyl-CoA carboxylase biotin carboxyl carrier protein [Granulicella sp. 5B5]QMV17552.1 acetyl-CoA carboxylase biotin carboxyl carrier protein [Granulicella sp. 5B5]
MDGNDLKELRELVEFLKASGIAEFEMERPDLKVGLKFQGAAAPASSGVDAGQLAALLAASRGAGPAPAAPVAIAASAAPADEPAKAPSEEDGAHIVKSPIVGTFYAAPSPDAPAFVAVGDTVSVGKVLCIIEAMKLMNEIESDAAGKIVKIFVQPGQPVEYGQPLFAIK